MEKEVMRLKNRRGFSLVELLAVIVIVGILATLAIVGVTRYLDSARAEKVSQNRKNVAMAAQLYLQSNRDLLPKNIGEAERIPLSDLRNSNYLKEDVTNDKGEDCMKNSVVRVYKYDDKDYSYTTYLYCGNDEVPAEDPVPVPAVENFAFSDKKNKSGSGNLNDVRNASFSFTIKGAKDDDTVGIYSYRYVIYVKKGSDSDYTEIFNSEYLKGGLEPKIEIASKSLSSYVDLTGYTMFLVKVDVLNEQGGKLEWSSDLETTDGFEDNNPPICGNIYGDDRNNNDWINKATFAAGTNTSVDDKRVYPGRISVECSDGAGSGCKRDLFTKTWPNNDMSDSGNVNYKYGARWGYITISDNAVNGTNGNNTTKCYVRVNVDLQSPTVTLYAYNGKTYTADRANPNNGNVAKITAKDTDIINGDTPSATIKANEFKNYSGVTNEKWLNLANYPDGLVFDAVVADNLYLDKWTWEVNDAYVAGGTADSTIRSTASAANVAGENGSKVSGSFSTNVNNNQVTNDAELAAQERGDVTGNINGIKIYLEGKRYGRLTVYDKAGNKTIIHVYANLDRTAPPVPNVTFNKEISDANYTAGTTSNYTDHNNWSNENIRASVENQRIDNPSTNQLSGWDHFDYLYFKQTGKNGNSLVWNNPSKIRVSPSGSSHQYGFDVTDQGTHIVQFDSCDKAGNCSAMSTKAYVKVDTVKPTCTIKTTYNGTSGPNEKGWLKKGESVTLSHNCYDEDTNFSSGCDSSNTSNKESYTFDYNIQTKKGGALGENKGGYVYDYAGNKSSECPKNAEIKIDITPPTCSTSVTNNTSSGSVYNGDWTTNNIVFTGTCSDTGGSGCSVSPSITLKNDINENYHFTENVVDVAGNKTSCDSYAQVKIDITKPTGTCTIEGNYYSDSNNSYKIVVNTKTDTLKNGAASGVITVKYWRSGDTSFGSSDTLSLSCSNSGAKEGWIQVIDNVGNESEKIKCEGSVIVKECCSEVTYKNGTTCSKKCDGGTYNQIAYSAFDNTRCSAKDLSSGGASCNTQSCCGSNAIFQSQSSCSKICGGGTMTYTYVSKFDDKISCGTTSVSCNTQICYPAGKPCNIRGKTKKNVPKWTNCTAGHKAHYTAYTHYCWDGSKYVTRKQNPQLNKYDYICPTNPYTEASGWVIIPD